MEYLIEQIEPSHIVVRFEDDSWASVGIGSEHSPEEIDHLVSFYDKTFYPPAELRVNTSVSVGDTRESKRIVEVEVDESGLDIEPTPPTDAFSLTNITFAALYYERNGDSSVMEALTDFFETAYTDISSEILVELIGQFKQNKIAELELESQAESEAEDIFEQAMKELEDE